MADERRRTRTLVTRGLTGVAMAGLLAAVVARRRRAGEWWSTVEDPCGPEGLALPAGTPRSVTTADGAVIDALVAGPGDGPAVVLAHCWTGTKEIWAPVARRLVAAGHRVVLYDQRGHGRSTMGDGTTSTDRLGDDLLAVLEAVGGTDVVLVGHSMGGMTVQAFATNHPDELRNRVRGIVLVATGAHVLPRPLPAPIVRAALGDGVIPRLARSGVTAIATRGVVGARPHRAHVEATHERFVRTDGAARAGFLVGMSHMDYRAGLASIHVPTTVLVGSHDRLTPVSRSRVLASRIPGAELRVLPGMGHMLPLEAPDEVARAIVAKGALARADASRS
jgi:non-heme chloroperoxidase